jgi:hypothetical protein
LEPGVGDRAAVGEAIGRLLELHWRTATRCDRSDVDVQN